MGNQMLEEHQRRLEQFTDELVGPYLARLPDGAARSKEFNDPVWGTLQLRPEEVVILDSPLLQRLRRIRQLGVVHFVYPAATHTRLEHSLGTLHQVQRLITTLNDGGLVHATRDAASGEPGAVIDKAWERKLRIAALCHDVGHGAMSHVSEYALWSNRQSEDLRLAFQEECRLSAKKQLSEIAAYYILGSPAFARLADEAAKRASLAPISDLGTTLQKFVMGKSLDPYRVLLHELISGPFDADKLDYVTRDAAMCGVPIVTDVPRLVQKVRATRCPSGRLPTSLKGNVPASSDGHQIIGVAMSGGRSLDELALARALMFDKVYRHQKVRAAEAMVFSLIEQIITVSRTAPAELILRLADDELLGLQHGKLIELAAAPEVLSADQQQHVDVVEDLSRRLRERDLFARGFAFAAVMTGDHYRNDPEHSSGLKRFLTECDDPKLTAGFVAQIVHCLREIAARLGKEDWLAVPGGLLEAYVRVSPPKPAPKTADNETGHAHLIGNDGEVVQFQDDSSETMPWADAYIATRDLGHVFCPRPMAPLVFIAAETVLREKYGVRLPKSMLAYAKQDETDIVALKRQLVAAGWYEGKPADLRPIPEILERADAEDRLAKVVRQLAGYSGPAQADKADRSDEVPSTIQTSQVLAFVKQFPTDDLIDTALDVLASIQVIRRNDICAALDAFVAKHPAFRGAACTPVGEYKDSGAVMAYYVGDAVAAHDMQVMELPAAINSARPIVFVDDFIGTGHQLVDVFEAWLREPRREDLGEVRPSLVDGLVTELRSRPVGIVFAAGHAAGAEHARQSLTALGMNVQLYVHHGDEWLQTLANVRTDPVRLERFTEAVAEIGAKALASYGDKDRDSDWIEGKKLGYGNEALLVTSTFNTPTATLTALWIDRPGIWHSLLPRRPKR